MDAAQAFQVIASDDDLLNKSNHVMLRLLYKQQLFMYVFPRLAGHESQRNNESGTQIDCTY